MALPCIWWFHSHFPLLGAGNKPHLSLPVAGGAGLPPMGVVPVHHLQDVAITELEPRFLAWMLFVLVGVVREQRSYKCRLLWNVFVCNQPAKTVVPISMATAPVFGELGGALVLDQLEIS